MNENDTVPELTLFGGPLHRLGRRLGLVREDVNTVRLGVALGLSTWGVLLVLALLQGFGDRLFSLALVAVHARLLVVIPLFFLGETWVGPRMAEFVRNIVRSGVVPRGAVPALEFEIARLVRWRDSWLSEAVFLLAAVLMPLVGTQLHLAGATAIYDPSRAVAEGSLASRWYWFVCLPLFRFLMLRWFWRLGLWFHFLRRVAKLPLNLVPTHPDGAAGLGYVEVVQTHFAPLVLAISALQAASFAEELSAGTMSFEALYPAIALTLVVDVVLFLGPLFILTPRLWACRVKGLSDYMEFAARYVNGFDGKWRVADTDPGEPLLGTPDLQSLADLSNSLAIVRNMRWVPLSSRLLQILAAAALLPLLPLLLLKYPVADLAKGFITRLTGL